jgi:hypothetical protein
MNIAGLPPVESAGMLAGMIEILILASAGFAIGAVLLALIALYNAAGMAALWLAVGGIFVVYAALQRRGVGYYDPGGGFSGSGPLLPAPGRKLPAPGPRQVAKSQRPALPGPKK